MSSSGKISILLEEDFNGSGLNNIIWAIPKIEKLKEFLWN